MEHRYMQYVSPSSDTTKRYSFAAAFFRGLGGLLEIGVIRRVNYDRTPVKKVTMEDGWRQVGSSLRSEMKNADLRTLKITAHRWH